MVVYKKEKHYSKILGLEKSTMSRFNEIASAILSENSEINIADLQNVTLLTLINEYENKSIENNIKSDKNIIDTMDDEYKIKILDIIDKKCWSPNEFARELINEFGDSL
jgi:hypothetical protein